MAALRSARISRLQGAKAAIKQLMPDLYTIMKSEDSKEGLMSFLERREARYTGR
jgi:enoyl-CoA hydratase